MRRLPLVLVLVLLLVVAVLLVRGVRDGPDPLDTAKTRAAWSDWRADAAQLAEGARGLGDRVRGDLDRLRGDLERLERQAADLSQRLEGAREAGHRVTARARQLESDAAEARRQLAELQRAGGERAATLRDDLARRLDGLESDIDALRRELTAGASDDDTAGSR